MRTQCTCSDCARSEGHISKVGGEYSPVQVDEDGTIFDPDFDNLEDTTGNLADGFMCDTCNEVHSDTFDAGQCCPSWECNFCGWTHRDIEDATTCCVITCDDCGKQGWPDFISDHSCGRNGTMRRQLPWEARGVVVDGREPEDDTRWKTTWALEPENHNVVRAAADYYLLEAMKSGLVGTIGAERERILSEEKGEYVFLVQPDSTIANHTLMAILRNEASERFNALVNEWDPILIAYTHMAVGGELRHHTAVGGEVLDSNRDRAWSGWKLIFDAVGTDALTDAAELFHEFGGGSFGGKPWADACLILHKRLTGQIDRALFLDRIFNAQHNGGCLLNKVRWAGDQARYGIQGTNPLDGMSVEEMTYQVLPAHGTEPEPDYSVLLAYASSSVRALFSDMHEYGRRARLDLGMSLSGIPVKPKVGETQFAKRARHLKEQQAKQAWEAAQPKSYKYAKLAKQYTDQGDGYKSYADTEIAQHKRSFQKAFVVSLFGFIPETDCGVEGCYSCNNVTGQYTYYMNTANEYYGLAAQQQAKYKAAVVEESIATLANAINAPAVPRPLPVWLPWVYDEPEDDDYSDGEGDYDDYDCPCCVDEAF